MTDYRTRLRDVREDHDLTHAAETLKGYIEAALRSEVDPEIEVVRAM